MENQTESQIPVIQQSELVFKDTTATKRIFALKKRIRAVSGGTSASKTISILVWLIDYCQTTKNQIVTVVAESVPHLQLGAIRDFQNIMVAHGYWDNKKWNETKHQYIFQNGSFLEFISFDKFGKAHGPRRDVLFINEANNIPYNIVDQLISRTRKIIWMDWNPSEEFWFYTDMLPTRKDVDFITLTYKDNEALDDITIYEIESHKNNKSWWTVYGLGQLGVIEGRIYSNWAVIEEIPEGAKLERRGVDFGYSNDPTAIVDIYKYNGGFILDEICYQKGLSNKNIADILKNLSNVLTIADSSEPKSIAEIKMYGVSIIPAVKGKDSIRQGIQYIQDQQISYTRRSVNLKKEYQNYLWKCDRDGNFITPNVPNDYNNHAMDAVRYGLDSYRPRKTKLLTGGKRPAFT
jgi:phage terminase large subunit